MTVRDLYDAALIEINKLESPSMLLEDYNYFINKAIQQYINKAYNRYEINQQATDDLGVLKTYSTINVITDESPRFPGESKTYQSEGILDYQQDRPYDPRNFGAIGGVLAPRIARGNCVPYLGAAEVWHRPTLYCYPRGVARVSAILP